MSKYLEINNLSKQFSDTQILKDINLTISKHSLNVIIGESGIGKSTLLKCLAGLSDFQGNIRIEGKVYNNENRNELQKQCIYIPQSPALWDHLKVIDNVAIVRRLLFNEKKAIARRKAVEFLEYCLLDNNYKRYPKNLSGGERQRVSIARGLATEKPIILLDEITSNLDPKMRNKLAENLKKLTNSKTLIFVTHDYFTAKKLSKKPYELNFNSLSLKDYY